MALIDPARTGLASLMDARSIAILGASENAGNPAGRAILYNLQNDFRGRIYPVNSKYAQVHGLTAYPSLAELPETVDLAIVAVPQARIGEAIRDARVRNFVVFADGFRETGNLAGEEAIAAAVRAQGARMLGPNCLGLMNREAGLVASFTPSFAAMPRGKRSGVAVISQSGAIGSYFCVQAELAGLLVQEWVSTGNEADLDVCDLLEYYLAREEIRVLVVQCEGLDVARFAGLLDAIDTSGKLLLIAKGGRSETGERAAASHTGALTGDDVAFDALLRGHRAIRTQSTVELIQLAGAAAMNAIPRGRRIGILSASGGAAILMADEAADLGLALPDPPATLAPALAELGRTTIINPVDLTGRMISSPTLFSQALTAMADPACFDALAIYLGGSTTDEDARAWLIPQLGEVRAHSGLPLFVCGADVAGFGTALAEADIPLYPDGIAAMRVLAPLAGIETTLLGGERWAARNLAPLADAAGEGPIKRRLAEAGLNVPAGLAAADADGAIEAASRIGYPVVLKLAAAGLEHKSDIGGVMLGISGDKELRAAAEGMARSAEAAGLSSYGFLVEQQLGRGIELIVSVRRDPQYSLLLIVGMGGVYTEILRDAVVEPLPSSDARLEAALRGMRGWPLLQGARGGAVIDSAMLVAQLREIARALAGLVEASGVREVELNPVIAGTNGLWIADAVAYR
ncbi:MAG: acetate--CoA ligase family protein [Novosphingobium sp.]